jgi:putative membrane protein
MKEKTENSNEKEASFVDINTDPFKPDDADKPLRPSIVVQAIPFNKKLEVEVNQPSLQSQTIFDEQLHVSPIEEKVDETPIQVKKPTSSSKLARLLWLGTTLLVITLSVAELYSAISFVITNQNWLAGGWLVLLSILLIAGFKLVFSEFKSLKKLKQQKEIQQYSADLFNTPAIGLGQTHCEVIARRLPSEYQPLVKVWSDGLHSHYTNKEVLSLFELKVLGPIDKMALNKITSNASAAGVMIAVSPFAMLDMLIVLWRNIKMINQLSSLYGVRLGYWGRVALIKQIFRSMLYAGAAEILSDAGNYALGVGLTGKISTRVAQGLGAGVLTSRIGLKALNECRPMPWLSAAKPGLSSMTNQLREELSQYLK